MTTFTDFDEAVRWTRMNGRDNCRPCDRLEIVKIDDKKFAVAIKFKSSGDLVGYAS